MFLKFSRIAVVLCLFLAVPGKASAQPLTLVSAVWPCEADNLTVTFDQPVDPSTATNGANYAINQGITVDMVMMGSQPNEVIVFAWPLAVGINYTLTVNNVTTTTSPPEAIAPNTQINFGCQVPPPCPVDAISLNTGLDHTSGALYLPGAADAFWTVVGRPRSRHDRAASGCRDQPQSGLATCPAGQRLDQRLRNGTEQSQWRL